jgi:hypothetical protein
MLNLRISDLTCRNDHIFAPRLDVSAAAYLLLAVGVMLRDSELRIEINRTRWCVATCLLLVALLLYNPFFTILSSSHDVSVQHPLSYRATVAGSELRRCTIEAQPLLPGLDAAVVHAATLLAPPHEIALVQPSDTAGLLSQALCDSIWFRPPPSA